MPPSPLDQHTRKRIESAAEKFYALYGRQPTSAVCSPGRAEILGNHTDYNQGFALASAIDRSVVGVGITRQDKIVRVYSDDFTDQPVEIELDRLEPSAVRSWQSYVQGIFFEFRKLVPDLNGFDFVFSSDLSFAGGISSSAAFELALAVLVQHLTGIRLAPLELALLAQRAENGPFVTTPCGLLDQASVALSKEDFFLFLDFRPTALPITYEWIPARIAQAGLTFVVAVDEEVKRNLGDTGYPERRAMCEHSLPILSQLLKREVTALRDVDPSSFERVKFQLIQRGGATMAKRVEHIVYENERVLQACTFLQAGDLRNFGSLLTRSGHSALELYELDDGTPELTSLVQLQRGMPEVWGVRNMGGGFSAISLALINNAERDRYQSSVASAYSERWGRELDMIFFMPAKGAVAEPLPL